MQVGGQGEGTGAADGRLNLRVTFTGDTVPPPPPPPPPPDSDGDGIADSADKCPSKSGAARDKNRDGCLDPLPPSRLSAEARLRATPTANGLRIVWLRVTAPKGAKVTVRCGTGCKYAKKATAAGGGDVLATAARTLTVKKLAGRTFRAGEKIRIYVTRKGRIGSYIQYTIKRGGFKRIKRCLKPGSMTPRKRCR